MSHSVAPRFVVGHGNTLRLYQCTTSSLDNHTVCTLCTRAKGRQDEKITKHKIYLPAVQGRISWQSAQFPVRRAQFSPWCLQQMISLFICL